MLLCVTCAYVRGICNIDAEDSKKVIKINMVGYEDEKG